MLHEADRPGQHGCGASIVDRQVDAPEAGQGRRKAQDPAHVGQPPAVDALVVVADEEDAVRRGCQEQRQPELARVHVLDLVDEQVRAARPPAGEKRRLRLQDPQRPCDQVVEVACAGILQRLLVGEEGARHGPWLRVGGDIVGRQAQVQLEPGEGVVQAPSGRGVRQGLAPAEDAVARHENRRPAGVAEDLEPERVEGADPHAAVARAG